MLKPRTHLPHPVTLTATSLLLAASPQTHAQGAMLENKMAVSGRGIVYRYLTNDLSLEAGVEGFLYYLRWNEEKYFDNFKNDLASAKAWGKNPVAIEQQAVMGKMTCILTRLFLQRRCQAKVD